MAPALGPAAAAVLGHGAVAAQEDGGHAPRRRRRRGRPGGGAGGGSRARAGHEALRVPVVLVDAGQARLARRAACPSYAPAWHKKKGC